MAAQRTLDPSIIVIFGISGDLSQRYLLPALYHLMKDNLLHEQTEIIGISRSDLTTDQLLGQVELCVNEIDKVCDPEVLGRLHDRLRMVQMDLTSPSDYEELLVKLNTIEAEKGVCLNRLYYLSIPPQVYSSIVSLMGQAGLSGSCPHNNAATRLLIEKPFGYDLASAKELIANTTAVFSEEQIYRIDHYLAKETVQNIVTFRFQNPIFEALWDARHISGIEISASQQIGIEGRARFYDPLGALRDFIQSHLLQLLALVTMDRPTEFTGEHIHAAKQAVLERVAAIAADQIDKLAVRGQYAGYREEVANPSSNTETFASIKLSVANERWQGVPITLWTGKALADTKTEICVNFEDAANKTNQLRFRIQPNEGIEIDLLAKKPGFDYEVQPVAMDFTYQQDFTEPGHPNAYERVLVDAVRGDRTLFATSQEVLESWRIVQPVIEHWQGSGEGLVLYAQGTDPQSLLRSVY